MERTTFLDPPARGRRGVAPPRDASARLLRSEMALAMRGLVFLTILIVLTLVVAVEKRLVVVVSAMLLSCTVDEPAFTRATFVEASSATLVVPPPPLLLPPLRPLDAAKLTRPSWTLPSPTHTSVVIISLRKRPRNVASRGWGGGGVLQPDAR
ncbi:hypothetical protein E2C01_003967 [Portunus trituberculatus]|uniref:Uncharacterized protein n=1 Tax=Portunus trituberculatus TaxID=210409 RepID=A0A5B7CQ35_PORTR|nr:hypothetical protein [Portunus trituberculatus]